LQEVPKGPEKDPARAAMKRNPIMSARCPKCGKKSHTTSGTSPRAMFCHGCNLEFEPEGTEGMADIPYGDPARIAERREQREIREKRQASEARRRQLRGGL